MKVAVALTKNILTLLVITAAASAIDGGIQKKIHGCEKTSFKISSGEMNDKIKTKLKIVQILADSNIRLKGVLKQLKMKEMNKQEDF